jgi:CRISPR system Cascade subunit CasA
MLNLLLDPWLPVIRRDARRCVISPAQITEDWQTNPVMALDWPRADFRIASLELLIGLLATVCPPEGGGAWLDWWEQPPTPDALAAALAPIAHAFALDGDGPRFLQDAEDLVSSAEPIERLLIESPGASTVGKNTDLLVRRDRVVALGRPAAAIALHTFQSWAPAGGAGNRTGLRGGGPLCTFVMPDAGASLWHALWANVPVGNPAEPADLPRVFPWLAPTVQSGTGRTVTPDDAHPLQVWWGMPRRIRLDFAAHETPQACGLTGTPDTVTIASWRQRPQGANYAFWGGEHPLSPHYRVKPESEILAMHPQPGGIGYRHWLGLVVPDARVRLPAKTVETWRIGRAAGAAARLLAAGYDMDNMKARGFVESEMPLPAIADSAIRARVDALAADMVRAADLVASLLRRAVRDALFAPGATVKLDWEMLSAVREQLWEATDAAFHEALAGEAARASAAPSPERASWHARLRGHALVLFDAAAPLAADGATLPKSDDGIRRLLRARRNLIFALQGYGRDGESLFQMLDLSPPQQKKPARKGRAA